MDLLINIARGLFVCVALLMLLVILMQRPKSEGLGAAFGGGVTENIFGAQTTNVLTKITGWLAAFFFILTFALSIRRANCFTDAGSHSRSRSGRLAHSQPASVIDAWRRSAHEQFRGSKGKPCKFGHTSCFARGHAGKASVRPLESAEAR